jgi:hypothetical protein
MIALWKQAKALELPVPDLEENVLFQALYAESHMGEMQEIYDSYMTRGRDKMLMEAYLNYWSHAYMLEQPQVPEQLFAYLAYGFAKALPLKESACLAYLKYLSTLPELSEQEHKIQDGLLNRYIRRNMYFGFYRNMDARLIIKYQLYDKQFVEYHGNPGDKVTIFYDIGDGNVHQEEMIEMYEGIFVKQFVLFFGDRITYEFRNETLSEEASAVGGELVMSDVLEMGHGDRFDLLNQMQGAVLYEETEPLAACMKTYQGLDEVTKSLFTLV